MDDQTTFLLRSFGLDYRKISAGYIRHLLEGVIRRYKLFNDIPYEDYVRLLHGYLLSVGEDNDIDLLRKSESLWGDDVLTRWNEAYSDVSSRNKARKEFEKMFEPKLSKLGNELQTYEKRRIAFDPIVLIASLLACLLILVPFIFVEDLVTDIEGFYGLPFILGVLSGGIAVLRCSFLYPRGIIREYRGIRYTGIGVLIGAACILISLSIPKVFPDQTYTRSLSSLFICIPLTVGLYFCSYNTGLKELIRCKTCLKGTLHKIYRYKAPTYAGRARGYGEPTYSVTYEYDGITYNKDVSSLKDFPFLALKKHNDNESVKVWIDPDLPDIFSLHRMIPPFALAGLLMALGTMALGVICLIFPEIA
ncbi:MAG: hypothetical protein J5685_00625 [Clostridiales bacterium]|nr:hypothetical protein [Clostridiales bacterium]